MATQTLDEEFLRLMCGDDDLMRAEFDAIIGANWGWPPPPPAARRPVPPPEPRQDVLQPHGQDHVQIGALARQRSPPSRKAGDAWNR